LTQSADGGAPGGVGLAVAVLVDRGVGRDDSGARGLATAVDGDGDSDCALAVALGAGAFVTPGPANVVGLEVPVQATALNAMQKRATPRESGT
jgi:hypothetical protein